jgi:ATP-dependent Clp protease adaptor protein ClpS
MTDEIDNESESGVATLAKSKAKEPSMYKVMMLNDDYTTMDFVIQVLQKFFHKKSDEANKIMMQIHKEGRAICGLYPYDIAATKVMQVTDFAKQKEMPLKCMMEK